MMVQPGQDRDGRSRRDRCTARPEECVAADLAGVTKTTVMQVAKVALGFETDAHL